ncbi:hypothetical protein F3Y22_tig00110332pilonHSYRG00195 [Hibiscus syriacus]|uniref:Uncharacterized protein n=1 Tax=Hibiscus syriacus TaxID=106335 RepID=A0A6A3AYM6_HIBSY|nr:hypothetical protein F3Y22_tig00110332pilonHSYRG00195 [Hibiscus syriacus]
MAVVESEESGVGRSVEGISSGQRCQAGEALAEWRSSEQLENGTPSTSPPYWDFDDDDGGGWWWWYILIIHKVMFATISHCFSVLLIMTKLLPGWSHLHSYNSVVNKILRNQNIQILYIVLEEKSMTGDGKSLELSKVYDGFIESDTLIIKAQVQVISFCAFWWGIDQNARRRMSREKTDDGNSGEDFNKDSIERDERHLTELGRRTVEILFFSYFQNRSTGPTFSEKDASVTDSSPLDTPNTANLRTLLTAPSTFILKVYWRRNPAQHSVNPSLMSSKIVRQGRISNKRIHLQCD